MAFNEDMEETAAVPDEAPPVAEDTAPREAFESSPPMEPAPKSRAGLVVVIAALLLLLVAGVAAAAVLLLPVSRETSAGGTGDTAQNKARVESTVGAMKALRINDYPALKPYLTDAAQNSLTPAQWSELASITVASGVPSATFSPTTWADDTTATVDYDIEGSTGTMTFAAAPGKVDVVTMSEVGVDGNLVYDFALVQAGTTWRVLSVTPKAETFPLDAAFVQSLLTPVEP